MPDITKPIWKGLLPPCSLWKFAAEEYSLLQKHTQILSQAQPCSWVVATIMSKRATPEPPAQPWARRAVGTSYAVIPPSRWP